MPKRSVANRKPTKKLNRPHSPKLAYLDPRFMDSFAARPIRILSDYFDPLVLLRREGVGETIVMFGSARILPKDRALARLEHSRLDVKAHRNPHSF